MTDLLLNDTILISIPFSRLCILPLEPFLPDVRSYCGHIALRVHFQVCDL